MEKEKVVKVTREQFGSLKDLESKKYRHIEELRLALKKILGHRIPMTKVELCDTIEVSSEYDHSCASCRHYDDCTDAGREFFTSGCSEFEHREHLDERMYVWNGIVLCTPVTRDPWFRFWSLKGTYCSLEEIYAASSILTADVDIRESFDDIVSKRRINSLKDAYKHVGLTEEGYFIPAPEYSVRIDREEIKIILWGRYRVGTVQIDT